MKRFFRQLFCKHQYEFYVTELTWNSKLGMLVQEQRVMCLKCHKDKLIKRYNCD